MTFNQEFESMATYAIGDIQGCFVTLQALLEKIEFSPQRDRLWLVGDLVNRGADSLAVLRWARDLGDRVTSVLGNHDLHLLGVDAGMRALQPADTLGAILEASDRAELLHWLRQCPLAHQEGEYLMVHAGLLPGWDWATAIEQANQLEEAIRGDDFEFILGRLGSNPTLSWSADLPRKARLGLTLCALTRLRMVTEDEGAPFEAYKGPPDAAPEGVVPWFQHPERSPWQGTVIFGHWAAMGRQIRPDIMALDSGCVWGNSLTAVRLEDRTVFDQPCIERLTLMPER
ncbi:MAG: symmetrical bis(5'-nucleosyl)-tetraphosphatase [Myxococcota bacterium]